jgi:hypothetical protein
LARSPKLLEALGVALLDALAAERWLTQTRQAKRPRAARLEQRSSGAEL